MKYPVEQIMYGNYIKYDKMAELTQQSFGANPYCNQSKNLNVYIDMNSLIKILYIYKDMVIEDYTVITSSIINLCSHIREFYRKIGVMTKIFIVNSLNCPQSAKQFYASYNDGSINQYNMKFIHSVIIPNLELLDMLCKYLPEIYFINDDTADSSTIIYSLILKDNTIPSMIYSKDAMVFQIATHFNNVVVFRPKKDKDGDVSYWADHNLAVPGYKVSTGRQPNFTRFSSALLSLMMAISGVKSRSITTQRTITQAEKLIEDYIDRNVLLNGYNSFDTVNQFCQSINGYEFAANFKAIDVVFQEGLYIDRSAIDTSVVDLYDPDAVKHINNNYFKNYPLDLNRL